MLQYITDYSKEAVMQKTVHRIIGSAWDSRAVFCEQVDRGQIIKACGRKQETSDTVHRFRLP